MQWDVFFQAEGGIGNLTVTGVQTCALPISSAALAAFEVAVAGGGAAFAGGEDVGVHAEAHAAAGLAPVEACFGEDLVETFSFGLRFDGLGAGDDHGADRRRDVVAADDRGCGAEGFDAGGGAGADGGGVRLDLVG